MSDSLGTKLKKAEQDKKKLALYARKLEEENKKLKEQIKKQNEAIEKYIAEHDKEINDAQLFALSCGRDIAIITQRRVYRAGEKRTKVFEDIYDGVTDEYFGFILDDSKCDEDVVFSRSKIDDEIAAAEGINFKPWEERH